MLTFLSNFEQIYQLMLENVLPLTLNWFLPALFCYKKNILIIPFKSRFSWMQYFKNSKIYDSQTGAISTTALEHFYQLFFYYDMTGNKNMGHLCKWRLYEKCHESQTIWLFFQKHYLHTLSCREIALKKCK